MLAFCAKHDYDFEEARDSWVAGSVGTITCAADCFVSMETIRIDIDRDAPVDEFTKWYDYDLTMHSLGATSINYDHWLMGAPRRSEAEIAELERLHAKVEEAKQALQDAIKAGDY